MTEEVVHFYSEGEKLDASFYWPKNEKAQVAAPVFIVCSGFTGLKNIHPARFSRFLTRLGYPCFGFDYRGFEFSRGKRKRVLLEEQITDISFAVSYVAAHPKTKGRPIILIGWGMGGGLILEAARLSPVKALIAINGFYDAQRVQKALRGPEKWATFLSWIEGQNAEAAMSGKLPDIDPFDVYPLDPVSEEYVNNVLRKTPGYNGLMVKLNFAHSLLHFAPEKKLGHLTKTPILIAHGEKNALHPPVEAESLFKLYPGPKELYWIPKAGHTEWMLDNNHTFHDLIKHIDAWTKKLK